MADSLNLLILPTVPLRESPSPDLQGSFTDPNASPRRLIAVTDLELVEALRRHGDSPARSAPEQVDTPRQLPPGIRFFSS